MQFELGRAGARYGKRSFSRAIAMLKKTMEKNGWTLEQAVSFFDLPISEKDTYAAVLN